MHGAALAEEERPRGGDQPERAAQDRAERASSHRRLRPAPEQKRQQAAEEQRRHRRQEEDHLEPARLGNAASTRRACSSSASRGAFSFTACLKPLSCSAAESRERICKCVFGVGETMKKRVSTGLLSR